MPSSPPWKQARSVYLDTNVLIYHVEDMEPYASVTEMLFNDIELGHVIGHTSTLTFLELNVRPYQLGKAHQALTHIAFFSNFPNFLIHPMTVEIANLAAQCRAKYRLQAPDAIHVATALSQKIDLVIGNDKDLLKVKEIRSVLLKDLALKFVE